MIGVALGLLRGVPPWAWVIAGLSAALWWQTDSLGDARDDLATYRVELSDAHDANDSNQRSIAFLRKANADFAKACAVDASKAAQQLAALRSSESNLRTRATALDREIRRLADEDPSVDAWLRAPVPGPLADRLRASAGGPN